MNLNENSVTGSSYYITWSNKHKMTLSVWPILVFDRWSETANCLLLHLPEMIRWIIVVVLLAGNSKTLMKLFVKV